MFTSQHSGSSLMLTAALRMLMMRREARIEWKTRRGLRNVKWDDINVIDEWKEKDAYIVRLFLYGDLFLSLSYRSLTVNVILDSSRYWFRKRPRHSPTRSLRGESAICRYQIQWIWQHEAIGYSHSSIAKWIIPVGHFSDWIIIVKNVISYHPDTKCARTVLSFSGLRYRAKDINTEFV